jgi:hypothetical protein
MLAKKNGEIILFILLNSIIINDIMPPKKYAPPSPRKILALGKLKNNTEKQTIIENKIKYFM